MNTRVKFPGLNLTSLRQRIQEVAGYETNQKQLMVVELQDFSARRSLDCEMVNLVNASSSTEEDSNNDNDTDNESTTSSEEQLTEKEILIKKILELQKTVEDVENKVIQVRQQNLQLEAENLVISDYILNLMKTSDTFQHLDDN